MTAAEAECQTPLSLRWEHRPYWSGLRQEFDISETGAAVILSLVMAGGPVSYSRNKNHYVRPRRYHERLYTYKKVTAAADYLGGQGLIVHDRVPPNNRGWQSSMSATPDLIKRTQRVIAAGPPMRIIMPSEPIILRDADGRATDYSDTPSTRRMRERLREINEAIRGTLLTGVLPCPVVRIFNRTFMRGGRFYALGGGWQSMSKQARKQITIAGEPVVEIDYKTLHPAILYAQAGARPPQDSYDLPGWPRELVKRALLILINAQSVNKARLSIAHQEEMRSVAEPGSQEAVRKASKLMDDIKRRHLPIARFFHSDKGAELMLIDSTLAETVMHVMMIAGVTVLPVHDSFLVQQSKADQLEQTMLSVAFEAGYETLTVSAG